MLRMHASTRSEEGFEGAPAAINTLSRDSAKLAPEPLPACKLSSGLVTSRVMGHKVGPPTFLSEKNDFAKKNMLASYVYRNFRDIMNSRSNLQKAEYMKGKQVLFIL